MYSPQEKGGQDRDKDDDDAGGSGDGAGAGPGGSKKGAGRRTSASVQPGSSLTGAAPGDEISVAFVKKLTGKKTDKNTLEELAVSCDTESQIRCGRARCVHGRPSACVERMGAWVGKCGLAVSDMMHQIIALPYPSPKRFRSAFKSFDDAERLAQAYHGHGASALHADILFNRGNMRMTTGDKPGALDDFLVRGRGPPPFIAPPL